MQTEEILSMLDAEIAKLVAARDLLMEVQVAPGLPKAKTAAKKSATKAVVAKKRGMSAEGKARIVEAQKKRWAAQRKAEAVAVKVPAKKSVAVKKTVAKKTVTKKTVGKKAVAKKIPTAVVAPVDRTDAAV